MSGLEAYKDGLTEAQYRAMKKFFNKEKLENSDTQAMFRANMRYKRLSRLGDLRSKNEEKQFKALDWALPIYRKQKAM